MEHEQMIQIVMELNKKAAETHDDNAAMKFSQAANNAANAFCSLINALNLTPYISK